MTEPVANAGTVFLQHLDAYRELVGTETVRRAINGLDPDQAAAVRACVPGAWISVDVTQATYTGIAREARQHALSLHPRAVKLGFARTIRGLWKSLLFRLSSDASLMSRAPMLYAKTYSRGRLRAELEAPGRANFELEDWPGIPELFLVAIAASMEAAIEATGRSNVRSRYLSTEDGARFVLSWSS